MIMVNGKEYPLYSKFVEEKDKWIGGLLEEEGQTTEIVDVELSPNGTESAFFWIIGDEFDCGFDTEYGWYNLEKKDGWTEFFGWGDNKFRIKEKNA
jgi:hypothetical protein